MSVIIADDAFFDDQVFYKDSVPADLAKNHDDYLYCITSLLKK